MNQDDKELLTEAVDTLGDVKKQIKVLKDSETKLVKVVKEKFEELNLTEFKGQKHTAKQTPTEERITDLYAFRAAVSDEEFMSSISAILKEVDKHTTEAMQKSFIKKVAGTPKLTVKDIK